jgi:hypothetical protein
MDEGKNKILIYPATIKFVSADDKKHFAAKKVCAFSNTLTSR